MSEQNNVVIVGQFKIGDLSFKQIFYKDSQRVEFIDTSNKTLMVFDSFGNIYSEKKDFLGKLALRAGKWVFEPSDKKNSKVSWRIQNLNQRSSVEFQQGFFIGYWKKKMTETEVYSTIELLRVCERFFQQVIYYMTDDRVEFLDQDRKPVMIFDCHCNAFLPDEQGKRIKIGKIHLQNNEWVFVPESETYQHLVCSKPDKGPEPIIELERDIFTKYWEKKNG